MNKILLFASCSLDQGYEQIVRKKKKKIIKSFAPDAVDENTIPPALRSITRFSLRWAIYKQDDVWAKESVRQLQDEAYENAGNDILHYGGVSVAVCEREVTLTRPQPPFFMPGRVCVCVCVGGELHPHSQHHHLYSQAKWGENNGTGPIPRPYWNVPHDGNSLYLERVEMRASKNNFKGEFIILTAAVPSKITKWGKASGNRSCFTGLMQGKAE